MQRILAKIFHDPDVPWILKGGTGLLARISGADWYVTHLVQVRETCLINEAQAAKYLRAWHGGNVGAESNRRRSSRGPWISTRSRIDSSQDRMCFDVPELSPLGL